MGKMDFYYGKWTLKKIKDAVNETSRNKRIYFDMTPRFKNTLSGLESMNEYLFKERTDLVLHIVTEKNSDLTILPSLKNIKKLELNNYESLSEIRDMDHLLYLQIYNVNKKALDIGFLEGLNNLQDWLPNNFIF